jgi:hypothetical protein
MSKICSDGDIFSVSWGPGATQLAIGGPRLEVWTVLPDKETVMGEVKSGCQLSFFTRSEIPVRQVAFSADGFMIASVGKSDRIVKVHL